MRKRQKTLWNGKSSKFSITLWRVLTILIKTNCSNSFNTSSSTILRVRTLLWLTGVPSGTTSSWDAIKPALKRQGIQVRYGPAEKAVIVPVLPASPCLLKIQSGGVRKPSVMMTNRMRRWCSTLLSSASWGLPIFCMPSRRRSVRASWNTPIPNLSKMVTFSTSWLHVVSWRPLRKWALMT